MTRRIVCALAWALFALLSVSQARADAPVNYYTIVSSGFTGWYSTQPPLCNAFGAFMSGKGDGQGSIFTGVGEFNNGLCRIYKKDGTGYQSWSNFSITMNARCAPNGTAPDTSKPLAQQCAAACPADGTDGPNVSYTTGWRTGPDVNSAWAVGGNVSPSSGCYNGCTVAVWGKSPWFKTEPGSNGYYEFGYDLKTRHSGTTCVGGGIGDNQVPQPTTPPPEKNRCPLGTSQIGTDSQGIPICRGDKKDTDPNKNKQTQKTTNADGSTSEKTTETTTNSDGSKTTKTTEKKTNADGTDGGTTETTTVGKTPDGKDGKSDSTDQDKQDLCKQHPTLNICKNAQISGTCESVSCDGDAIQCAIARDVQMAKCKAEKDEQAQKDSSQYQLGNAAMAGNDPMASKLPTKENAQVVNVGGLSATGFAGGGSCFSDKTFTLLGRSFTIPFSSTCQYLIALRYVVMLIALLASFRMLSGAVIRE